MLLAACALSALLQATHGLGQLPEAQAPKARPPVQVYVLTGQSNSLGTTGLEGTTPAEFGPGAHPADARAEFFWSNVTSTNAAYPPALYGDSGSAIDSMRMQQGDGGANPTFWGPEHGLARRLWESDPDGDPVLVIKVSRGGGGNTFWHRPAYEQNSGSGHMWGHLRDTVDTALDTLSMGGRDFQVQGLLYLQGESNDAAEALVAGIRLESLASDLRLHMESRHPGTTSQMRVIVGEIAASTSSSTRQLTTLRQMEFAAQTPFVAFVRTADLPLKADNIHFGRDSKLAIGHRFADALMGATEPFRIGEYRAAAGRPAAPFEVRSPVASGFAELGAGAGIVLTGVIDGTTPAWRIFDGSSVANPGYQRSLTTVDFQGMFDAGWSFRTSVRVIAGGGLALWSVAPGNDPGWGVTPGAGNMNGFVLDRVGSDELRVALWGGSSPPILLGPGSANLFHKIELRGAAGSPRCDLYVDDAPVLTGVDLTAGPGLSGFQNRLLFNSGQTNGTGLDVHWAELELTSQPL